MNPKLKLEIIALVLETLGLVFLFAFLFALGTYKVVSIYESRKRKSMIQSTIRKGKEEIK